MENLSEEESKWIYDMIRNVGNKYIRRLAVAISW
jgi:hypothetical protein